MEVEKDNNNNNNSEGIKSGCKDSKRGNNGNNDNHLVAEEKDNPLEVPMMNLKRSSMLVP